MPVATSKAAPAAKKEAADADLVKAKEQNVSDLRAAIFKAIAAKQEAKRAALKAALTDKRVDWEAECARRLALGLELSDFDPNDGSEGEYHLLRVKNIKREITIEVAADGTETEHVNDIEEITESWDINMIDNQADNQFIWEATHGQKNLFGHLDSRTYQNVIDAFEKIEFKAGDRLMEQGDKADYYYVVQKGECHCVVAYNGGEEKDVLSWNEGDDFGALALLYSEPRAASVVAHTDTTCWRIGKEAFHMLTTEMNTCKSTRIVADDIGASHIYGEDRKNFGVKACEEFPNCASQTADESFSFSPEKKIDRNWLQTVAHEVDKVAGTNMVD